MKKEPVLTEEEQLFRLTAREDILSVMNRRCYYMSAGMREEELRDLWVSSPEHMREASLGYNNGYYVGIDSIRRHYVGDYRGRLENAGPEFCGYSELHTANTNIVKFADDNETAKYMAFHADFIAEPDKTGIGCRMTLGLYFADLIREEGSWKIFQLVIQHDHTITPGEKYSEVPMLAEFGDDCMERFFGTPDIRRDVHIPRYGWETLFDDIPRPYETYTEKNSYGPGGDLGKMYYDRLRW